MKVNWITWLHENYETVCILYTAYVHWFWKCGFYPCKFNTKHYLQKEITVRAFFERNMYVGSSSNNGNPKKRLNTV